MTVVRKTVLFVVASFALRLAVLLFVVWQDVPLLYDEVGYFGRATGFREIVLALVALESPSTAAWVDAYGLGQWPPVHSLILGIGLAIGGAQVGVARLVVVLLSALTTGLVYRLARALADEQSARIAAVLHLIYPTFIAFSHYLWSETTYSFLLAATVLAVVKTAAYEEPASGRSQARVMAATTGALLGLTVLTRAAALPLVLAIPAWLFWKLRGSIHDRAAPTIILAVASTMLLPWQALLFHQEGRFVPVTTLAGYNLALGNNRCVANCGSSWGDEINKRPLHVAIGEAARARDVDRDTAAAGIAWQEIQQHPWVASRRAAKRLAMFWAPDFFPLRHLFGVIYPPVPLWLAPLVALVTVTSYITILVCVLVGLMSARDRPPDFSLLLCLALFGILPAAATIGISRLHFATLVVLLPAAGRGWGRVWEQKSRIPRWLGILAGTGGLLALTLPCVVGTYLTPSSYYRSVVGPVARWLGTPTEYSDRLELRGSVEGLSLEVLSADAWLTGRRRQWQSRAAESPTAVDVFSGGGEDISVRLTLDDRSVEVRPIRRDAWRAWRAVGIDGLEVRWAGGGARPASR